MKKQPIPKPTSDSKNKTGKEGYPLYPDSDDIYSKFKEEQDIDPEDVSKTKEIDTDLEEEEVEELDFNKDVMGTDLDIPGSDMDDADEESGNEDEENNYYSIGGDKHHDLEEGNEDDF